MKQIIQNGNNGKISIRDLPSPKCLDDGVLVRTRYSVISAGTEKTSVSTARSSLFGKAIKRPDLVNKVIDTASNIGIRETIDIVKDRLNFPMALGYSLSGEVIEVGRNVTGISVGDRVACGGGGYASHAEINYIPKNLVVKIGENVDYKSACYTTVGAIAMQGVRQANATIGETIAVIGLGLIGQLTSQILKAAGCNVIGIDVKEFSLKIASGSSPWSIDYPLMANDKNCLSKISAITNGNGVDKVIVTAASKSSEPLIFGAEILRDRGILVIVGSTKIDIPRSIFYEKEIDVKFSRSYGPGRYDYKYEEKGHDYPIGYVRWTENRNMKSFVKLIENESINPNDLTTNIFNVLDAKNAFDMIVSKNQDFIGILIKYPIENDINKKFRLNNVDNLFINDKSPPIEKNCINVGLIGLGKFSQTFIVPNLVKSRKANLHTVCNNSGLSADHSMRKFKFLKSTTDALNIFKSSEIDTIFITSRHDSHAEYILSALENNKNIFVEKPIAINEKQLEKIKKKFVKNYSGKFMVGYNRRFSSISNKIKKSLISVDSPISILYRINAGKIPIDHWIQDLNIGGGRLIGEVCHFIDYVLFITSSRVRSCYASTIKTNIDTIPNADTVHIQLNLSNGSIATICYLCDGSKKMGKEYIEIIGNESSYVIDDFKNSFAFLKNKKLKCIEDLKIRGIKSK